MPKAELPDPNSFENSGYSGVMSDLARKKQLMAMRDPHEYDRYKALEEVADELFDIKKLEILESAQDELPRASLLINIFYLVGLKNQNEGYNLIKRRNKPGERNPALPMVGFLESNPEEESAIFTEGLVDLLIFTFGDEPDVSNYSNNQEPNKTDQNKYRMIINLIRAMGLRHIDDEPFTLTDDIPEGITLSQKSLDKINSEFEKSCLKLEEYGKVIWDTLLDGPQDEKRNRILASLQKLITFDKESLPLFAMLGLSSSPDWSLTYYRKCKNMIAQDKDPEVFTALGDVFLGAIEAAGLVSLEDVDEAIFENLPTEEEEVDITEYRKIIGNIFSKSSDNSYIMTHPETDWQYLVPPDKVEILFDVNKPTAFEVQFSWKNENGEQTWFDAVVDAKKNTFDWNNIIEETKDSKVFATAIKAEIGKVFANVLQQATEKQQQRKKARETRQTAPSLPTQKRERNSDEIYKLRKTVGSTSIPSAAMAEMVSKPESETQIALSIINNDEVLIEKMASLGSEDRRITLESIHSFNERQGGRLSRKQLWGDDGKPLYTLGVGTPGGQVRVLVSEAESAKGSRKFAVIDIGYHKDIYRKPRYRG